MTLRLRKLAFFMLVMMPASAKSSENATSAAAIRGDFMALISAVLCDLEIWKNTSGQLSLEFVSESHAEMNH